MHPSAYALGRLFFEVNGRPGQQILEIGSANVNGTLRDHRPEGSTWIGLDQGEGEGVDVVGSSHAMPFEDGRFDIVVSSSCLEHDPMFWITFLESLRVLKQGGLAYHLVPAKGPHHAYPLDCWRFYPDAGEGLAMWARRAGHETFLMESFAAGEKGGEWLDVVLVFVKGPFPKQFVPMKNRLGRPDDTAVAQRLAGADGPGRAAGSKQQAPDPDPSLQPIACSSSPSESRP